MATQQFSAVVATPGTPQRLTSATVPAQATLTGALAGFISTRGCYISFQAPSSNTAAKSIFVGCATMNVAAKTGIGWQILTGASPIQIFLTNGTTDLADYWIDTDSATPANERLYVAVIG